MSALTVNITATHNGHACELSDVQLVGNLHIGKQVKIIPTRRCSTCGEQINVLYVDEVIEPNEQLALEIEEIEEIKQ